MKRCSIFASGALFSLMFVAFTPACSDDEGDGGSGGSTASGGSAGSGATGGNGATGGSTSSTGGSGGSGATGGSTGGSGGESGGSGGTDAAGGSSGAAMGGGAGTAGTSGSGAGGAAGGGSDPICTGSPSDGVECTATCEDPCGIHNLGQRTCTCTGGVYDCESCAYADASEPLIQPPAEPLSDCALPDNGQEDAEGCTDDERCQSIGRTMAGGGDGTNRFCGCLGGEWDCDSKPSTWD